jgi:hypothetical protein
VKPRKVKPNKKVNTKKGVQAKEVKATKNEGK